METILRRYAVFYLLGIVIPAKAGIQHYIDSRFHGNGKIKTTRKVG